MTNSPQTQPPKVGDKIGNFEVTEVIESHHNGIDKDGNLENVTYVLRVKPKS